MTDHPELENSVAAFVLGAAGDEEMDRVRAHLPDCPECRALAGRLQRAADALPLAIDIIEAPARLRSRILGAAASSAGAQARPPMRARIIRLPSARIPARWAWSPSRFAPTAAVAALTLAVMGLGVWNLQLAGQLGRQGQGRPASVTLTGHGQLTGAQATVVDFRGNSVALVTFSRLPVPPPGKVYEVWLIPASGAPEAVGVFQPDGDGSKTMVMNRDLRLYRVFAITLEDGPAGTAAPTQQPLLSGATV